MATARAPICRLLDEDPDLREAVPAAQRADAARELLAPVLHLGRGPWRPLTTEPGGVGLLVLEGLIVRRVTVDGRSGAELLGDGDLLRPWQGADAMPPLAQTSAWRVLTRSRLAVLDQRVTGRMGRYPGLTGALVARALQRSRNLAVNMAIVHQPRVDIRLHMLLWHLADRWGRVVPGGVLVPLGVPQSILAELVASRRPTVSGALGELSRRGLVVQTDRGWLLPGPPPGPPPTS